MAPAGLLHPQVDADFDDVEQIISAGQYRPNANNQPLQTRREISDVWPEKPDCDRLHVFVSLPDGVGSPTLTCDVSALYSTSLCAIA